MPDVPYDSNLGKESNESIYVPGASTSTLNVASLNKYSTVWGSVIEISFTNVLFSLIS